MKIKILLLTLSVFLAALSFAGNKNDSTKIKNTCGIGAAIKITSLGPGIEVIKAFDFPLNLRLGATYFRDNRDLSKYLPEDEFFYNYLRVGTVSLIGDWQFGGFFHVSAGGYYNYSEEKYEHTYPAYDKTITTKVKYWTNKINPYVGIGFGRSISKRRLISFGVDLGTLFIGKIKYQIDTNDPDYEKPEDVIKVLDKIEKFQFYPYLNFQLSFRLVSWEK